MKKSKVKKKDTLVEAPVVEDEYKPLKDEIMLHLTDLATQGILTRQGAISDIEDILMEKGLDNLKVKVLSLGNKEFTVNVENKL